MCCNALIGMSGNTGSLFADGAFENGIGGAVAVNIMTNVSPFSETLLYLS